MLLNLSRDFKKPIFPFSSVWAYNFEKHSKSPSPPPHPFHRSTSRRRAPPTFGKVFGVDVAASFRISTSLAVVSIVVATIDVAAVTLATLAFVQP
jgi:hypothetical protein